MAGSALTDVNGRGLLSARPSAGRAGRNFYGTDTLVWYRDNGSSWDTQSGAGIADPTTTRGDMLFRNNGGAVARLALGAANTVLHGSATDPSYSAVLPADMDVSADVTTGNATSGHHGLLPKLSGSSSDVLKGDGTFAAAGGAGALNFIQAQTASASATLDLAAVFSATYDDYLIEIVGIIPATDAADLQLHIGTGGGPTYDSTGSHYSSQLWGINNAGVAVGPTVQNTGIPIIGKQVSNVVDYGGVEMSLRLQLPQSTVSRRNFAGQGTYVTNPGSLAVVVVNVGVQFVNLGTALTSLRFLFSAGNIASGTIRIYGISKT